MTGRRLLFLLLLLGSCVLRAQSADEIRAYIAKYTAIALDQEKEYGIPAPITLAQGILESGAGTSQLTLHSNNHFGIKALGGWTGGIYLAWDDEPVKSKFRSYASAEDSFRDHSRVLKESSRYSSLFLKSVYDYRGWAIGLQEAGYATAPSYARALIGYIDAYQIYTVNGGVKLRPGKKVTITKEEVVQADEPFEWELPQEETTGEQEDVTRFVNRLIVSVNDVPCTQLHPGETLSMLAQKYGISKYDILAFNELEGDGELKEGDLVFLEKKRRKYTGIQEFYRVKEGDTLYEISQQFGVRLASLAKLIGKQPYSRVHEGEKLKLR